MSWLVEKRKKWYEARPSHALLADRVAVFSDLNGSGIGVVTEIDGDDVYYTLFSPNVVYRKRVKDVQWNERNWRWETTGLGGMRKLERARGNNVCQAWRS